MLSKHFFLLLLLVPAVLMTNKVVMAQDEDVEIDTETDAAPDVDVEVEGENVEATMPDTSDLSASNDVTTSIVFPEHANKEFPAGDIITAVVGFHNNGESAFKVEALRASLRFPQDFRQIIQNFTVLETPNAVVPPKTHASFLYKFRPYEKFEPKDFGFIVEVICGDAQGDVFLNEAFNGTVNVVEGNESFDFQEAFSYVTYVAVLAAGFLFFRKPDGKKSYSTSKKEKVEVGTKDSADNEWLVGTHAADTPKKKKGTASTN